MITPEHRQYLRDSAITDPFIDRVASTGPRGIEFLLTGPTGRQERRIKIWPAPAEHSDEPKYVAPAGVPPVVSVPPGHQPLVEHARIPLLIVEGTKQHLAAAAAVPMPQPNPLAIVGVQGCWGWSHDGILSDDMRAIPWEDRDVIVAFDADRLSKRNVYDAGMRLKEFLEIYGVKSVRWAKVPGGDNTGLDDVLASIPEARRADTLMAIVTRASAAPGRPPAQGRTSARAQARTRAGLPAAGTPASTDLARVLIAGTPMMVGGSSVLVYRDGMYHNGSSKLFESLVGDLTDQVGLSAATLGATVKDVHGAAVTQLTVAGRVMPTFLDAPLISFKNGVLDLDSGELLPHSPDVPVMVQFQVDWDPSATCPFYESWIAKHLPAPGAIDDLEEVMGQMFDRTKAPARAAVLFGPSRSGKGTFTRLAEALVGSEGRAEVSLHELSDDKFASARLYGAVLNVYADLSAREVRDLSAFKLLLGEDPIGAQRKFGQPFTFYNTALNVFSANQIPPVSEASQAYFARVKPFLFPSQYLGREDPRVRERLLGELQGVAVRWVQGLKRLRDRGYRFRESDERTFDTFRRASDQVAAFVAQRCELVDSGGTVAAEVFQDYRMWSDNQGLKRNTFYKRLENVSGVKRVSVGPKKNLLGFNVLIREGHEPWTVEHQGSEQREAGGSPVGTSGSGRDTVVSPYSSPITTHMFQHLSLLSRNYSESRDHGGNPHDPENPVLAIDTETTAAPRGGTLAVKPRLRVVSGALGDEQPWAYPEPSPEDLKALGAFPGLLVGHNLLRFDAPVLARAGCDLDVDRMVDTLVLSRLVWPVKDRTGAPGFSLNEVAARLGLEVGKHDIKDLVDTYGWSDIPLDNERYLAYAAQDAKLHGDVYRALLPLLPDQGYAEREMMLARMAAKMSRHGMLVDVDAARARVAEHQAKDDDTRAWLQGQGIEVKARLSDAGKHAAAAAIGGVFPMAKNGAPLLNKTTLAPYKDHPVAAALLSLNGSRGLAQQVLDYVDDDGRVRPDIDMCRQATGRWSITAPALTTFGKKGDLGDRDLFVAAPGHVLFAVDLSQIDVRGVAALSQDSAMIAALQPGHDWHTSVAIELFGDPAMRPRAKDMSHAINYNAQAKNVASATGMSVDEAQATLDRMESRYRGLAQWKRRVIGRAESGLDLPNGWGRNVTVEPGFEFTQAPGRSGQSWARDAAMDCLLRLWQADIGQYVCMHVHDEFVFEVPEDRSESIRDAAVAAMTFEAHGVPVLCESTGFGRTWGDVYREA